MFVTGSEAARLLISTATSTFSSPIEMYGTQTFDEVFKQGLFLLSLAYYGSIHAMKKNQEVVQLTSSEKLT